MDDRFIFNPLGGLNSDDSDKDIPQGDYRECKNIDVGTGSSPLVIKSLSGTKQVGTSYASPLDKVYDLGVAKDSLTGSAIHLMLISNAALGTNTHVIKRVYSSGIEEFIVNTKNYVLFENTNRITHALVVDGMLLWTQPGAAPKKINLSKAKKFTESGGSDPEGYVSLDAQTIYAGAFPPSFAPTFKYTETESEANYINNSLYQFAYYYIYDDNEISALSPYSRISAPVYGWNYRGTIPGNTKNAIEVKFNNGHNKVKRIGLAYRESELVPWKVFTELEKEGGDNNEQTIIFTGNESYSLLSTPLRNYDDIPVEASAMAALHTGNIVYGDLTKGMDKPLPSVDLEGIIQEVEGGRKWLIHNAGNTTSYADIWFDAVPTEGVTITVKLSPYIIPPHAYKGAFKGYSRPDGAPTDNGYSGYTLNNGESYPSKFGGTKLNDYSVDFDEVYGPPLEFTYTVTAADVSGGVPVFLANMKAELDIELAALSASILANIANYPAPYDSFGETTEFPPFSPATSVNAYNDVETTYTIPNLASPFPYVSDLIGSYCLRITDAKFEGEIFEGAIVSSLTVSPESGVGDPLTFIDVVGYFRQDLTDVISDYLPNDIVRSLKSGAYHVFGINYYDKLNRDSTVVTNNFLGSGGFKVYIPFVAEQHPSTPLWSWKVKGTISHKPPVRATHYQWVRSTNSGIRSFGWFHVVSVSNDTSADFRIKIKVKSPGGEPHAIAEGDRLRLVMNVGVSVDWFEEINDLPVLKTELDGADTVIITEYVDAYVLGLGSNTVVEVYRSNMELDEEEQMFVEIGEEYAILNPGTENRAHSGNVQDQNASQPAISILDYGDIWVRKKQKAITRFFNYYEDYSFSDFFPSKIMKPGRLALFDALAQEKRYGNHFIHGGKYFSSTKINDLFLIKASNEESVNVENGNIVAMAVKGYILKILQPTRITSVYIGRTVASNTDGETNEFSLINSVFGTINPSAQHYGCRHPESVCVNGGHMYFFDIINGVWVRDAYNGMIAISDYKYKEYWNEVSEYVRTSNSYVLSVFDRKKEALVTYVSGKEIVLFKEGVNRWLTHIEGAPTLMSVINNVLYLYKNGNTFHDGFGTGLFMGESLVPSFSFVCNLQPMQDKVFDSIAIASNYQWRVDAIIPAEFSASKREMATRIIEDVLEREEGQYVAEFRGDINTPGMSESIALINGDLMRGETILVRLQYNQSKSVYLKTVNINLSYSPPV